MSRRNRSLWMILMGLVLAAPALQAQDKCATANVPGLTLPAFSTCSPVTQPVLPVRWNAAALMSPFDKSQLAVGAFTYDGSLATPAARTTLYGLEKGTADLLIVKDQTYLLVGSYDKPTSCVRLDKAPWQVPSRQWLNPQAKCVGEAPLQSTKVQWWKIPVEPKPETTWFWFTSQSRLPWRTMFAQPAKSPAIVGEFSMSYFPAFASASQTNLKSLVDLCANARSTPYPGNLNTFIASNPSQVSDAARRRRIQDLIPGLSYEACANQPLPVWPEQFGLTTFMTAVRFDLDPFPTEVLYQWQTESQRTRMCQPASSPDTAWDALLLGEKGYIVQRNPKGDQCAQDLPGIPKPDWMRAVKCSCRGVIKDHPTLSPKETTLLINCPLIPPRVFWTWYTTEGRPVVFMETSSKADVGTGLSLADYYSWQPRAKIPDGVFKLPDSCKAPRLLDVGSEQFHHGVELKAGKDLPKGCFTCHLGKPKPPSP
jgi:hypothetical protein